MTAALSTIKDVDYYFDKVCLETPLENGLQPDLLADQVAGLLDVDHGSDPSQLRRQLTQRQLTSMARSHLRRRFDPEKTAHQEQLTFTIFGDDIQARYPITVAEEGRDKVVEYQSPFVAPVDQLSEIAIRDIKVGSTRQRRGNALLAFLAEHRDHVPEMG